METLVAIAPGIGCFQRAHGKASSEGSVGEIKEKMKKLFS